MKKTINILSICTLIILGACSNLKNSKMFTIPLLKGEEIWYGAIAKAHTMPLSDSCRFDFYANNCYNQLQPLILSNKGLYVWSEEPYKFEVKGGQLTIIHSNKGIKTGREGSTLPEAREYASKTFFPASGKMPDELMFSCPQYNTWIELNYNHNQEDVLKYANAIIDNGLPPGVFMIDDTWQEDYGLWDFHPGRFPDPKKMVDELHRLGFKVMLWVCPFVSADQAMIYNELKRKKAFLLEKTNEGTNWEKASLPAMIRWWNGVSAELDFSNPEAVIWFNSRLDYLVEKYGIDGFKFDAADMQFYPSTALTMAGDTPNKDCILYTQFGLKYPLNEYRACWKRGGQPLVQRLVDKRQDWGDVQKLIPHMVAAGLMGYTFSCPDMIGGGLLSTFASNNIDQELVVRSAQIHALMPMMQFSVAPWRILDKEHMDAVKKAVDIRMKFTPAILELARKSAQTGKPIISNIEYYFPGQGYELVNDQFMLGGQILVAPMVKSGNTRTVILPKGMWKSDEGKEYAGGKEYKIDVPLGRLSYFERIQ